MKRMQPLVLAVGIGLAMCFAATSVTSAEETKKEEAKKKTDPAKRKSYKDRLFDDSESYDVTGMKIKKEDVVQNYPLAARVAPSQEGEPSLATLRNKMILAFQKNKDEEARKYAEELRDHPKANVNDKATAVKVMTLLVTKVDRNNHAGAIPLLEEAMEINGLDNNAHYAQMSELAQRLLLEQDYPEAYKWAERFLQETKAEKIEILKVKGNALFRMPNRVKDSLGPLEKVHAMDPTDVQATQMLAKAYADSGDSKKAAELTKLVVQATGNDRVSQVNLAITYFDSKQYEEAFDVIAQLRSTNQLIDERDYLTAMNVYSAMKNKEADIVAVMEAGFASGALKPTAPRYAKLAEAYYYSDLPNGMQKAIETWNKAAPMAKDGKIYLNLAIVQCQNQMFAACKESAKNAIAKGGINPEDAKKQIAIADKAK